MPPTAAAKGVREADVRAMLSFIGELNSFDRPEDFRQGALPGIRELVSCEIISYNEVEFEAGKIIVLDDPPGAVFAGAAEIFVRLGHQNPLVGRYQRTRDGRPYKWSDMITRRELHATDLYREAYRPMGVEYQMAFALPAPPEVIIALALSRGQRDFSERDRRLLNIIRGPMIQAYRTVQRYAALMDRVRALEQGLERSGTGVVILERGSAGRAATFVSDEAARLLSLGDGASAQRLTAGVRGWLAEIDAAGSDYSDAVPLVVPGAGGSRVVVHFVPARHGDEPDSLLVERSADPLSTAQLRAAGLTPRESEILRLVAQGRSDGEIAAELTVSPRTVQKHLEHVYEKLGARSRTQAVLTAWSISRLAPP